MSERIKAFIYIRVKDDTHQTDWVLGEDVPSGTIAVAVPEFTEEWKKTADDRYAQEFGLALADIEETRVPSETEAIQMQTAREMLLEQDYQFAAEIEGYSHELGDRITEVADIERRPDQSQWQDGVRLLVGIGEWRVSVDCDWEGSFRVIQAQKSAKERVDEAVAQGKTVLCAIPMPLGARYLVLGPDGQFAGAYETTSGGVKEYQLPEVRQLLVLLQNAVDRLEAIEPCGPQVVVGQNLIAIGVPTLTGPPEN